MGFQTKMSMYTILTTIVLTIIIFGICALLVGIRGWLTGKFVNRESCCGEPGSCMKKDLNCQSRGKNERHN
jgi:hypothetical protein